MTVRISPRDLAIPSTSAVDAPGTPGWWASRRDRSAQPRRGRPPRSFEPIVAAASKLVDEQGAGAFSMRLLAERLHTSTATLYRHVAGKEELMVHVVDGLFAEIDAPHVGERKRASAWQDAARTLSLIFHDSLSRRPTLLPLLGSHVPIGPNALAVRESAIAMLMRFGFPPGFAASAFTVLAHYVIGFSVQQYAPGAPRPEEASALGDYYRRLDPTRYPTIVAAADALTAVPLEEEFLEGLQFVLDGIERARRRC